MTYTELIMVMFVSLIIFTISIVSVLSLFDKVMLDEELFKTIVYCGLWKSKADVIVYDGNKVSITYTVFNKENIVIRKNVDFGKYFENSRLKIIPFSRVDGGTFGKYKIEPIVFDVSW